MIQSQANLVRIKNKKPARARPNLWLTLLAFILTLATATIVVLAVAPIVFPDISAELADGLLAVIGPEAVANLESVSFQLQDGLNYLRSEFDGGQVQIALSSPSPNLIAPTSASFVPPTFTPTSFLPAAPKNEATPPPPLAPTVAQNTPIPSDAVVSDPPQIGWQAYGQSVNGQPVLARTMLQLDTQRSYAGIALVRIDLSKLQLHIMPGVLEPPHPEQIVQVISKLGMVPSVDQARLIAAFNGGFKNVHGQFGMMAAGVTLRNPKPGLSTIAFYRNGSLKIGVWATDINASLDLIAFRQNCAPLVQLGQINPMLYTVSAGKVWGFTNNEDITWRTGLGLTFDARYLIYAVGNGTSAETLAQALQQAGAYNAMQLDIHQPYTHFLTYQLDADGFTLTASPLLNQMIYKPRLYLAPNPRDFFYLTAR